jgi:membrane-associated phospholipid phosphatase
MPTLGCFLILLQPTYLSYAMTFDMKLLVVSSIFISTFFIPVLLILAMKQMKIIRSLEMAERQERLIPLFITLLCFVNCYYQMSGLNYPDLILKFILGATIGLFVVFVVSFFWKISAHAVGFSGLIGALFIMSKYYEVDVLLQLMLLIVVLGFVLYSRLKLDAHTQLQLYVGSVVGFLSIILVF